MVVTPLHWSILLLKHPVYRDKNTLQHPERYSKALLHLVRGSAQFIGRKAIKLARDNSHYLCKKLPCFSHVSTLPLRSTWILMVTDCLPDMVFTPLHWPILLLEHTVYRDKNTLQHPEWYSEAL